ncbi:hypothetical protein GOBAR_DD12622 [Gossypium barbadense]|nr:hypothetical protein GOBAR_DD12622 [Gossypium barbadense]
MKTWSILSGIVSLQRSVAQIKFTMVLGGLRIVARAIWALWTARNKALHEGVIQTAQEKTNMINYYIRELNVINEKLLVRRVESERWRIPVSQDKLRCCLSKALQRDHVQGS